jgi:hypothetical protein
MKDRDTHLNEDQIIVSLMDENDLTEDMKGHLLACPACQEKRTALISELENLGKMAKDLTPLPKRKPVLPVRESRRFGVGLPIFAAGSIAAVVIAFLGSIVFFNEPSKQMGAQLSTETGADFYLMDDIFGESALPEYYLDIAGASYSYFDDEFLEFIVPLEEDSNSV